MQTADNNIKNFEAMVRQLILRYKELKSENAELYSMVDERDKEIQQLKKQVAEKDSQYTSLMDAKMLTISDGDIETSKKRINKLIRSVNQCITILSEQK